MTESSSETANQEKVSIGTLVSRLARTLDREASPGDVAALRRMRFDGAIVPAFFRLAADVLEPAGVLPASESARIEAERRWAIILSALARLEGLHIAGRRFGAALAESGFSEARFLRLLRSRDEALADSVSTAAHFLASKAASADLADMARLVLSDGRADEDAVRRAIARDFYAHLPH